MSDLLNVLLKETSDRSRDCMPATQGDVRRLLLALDAERAERELLEERVAKLEAGEVKVSDPAAKETDQCFDYPVCEGEWEYDWHKPPIYKCIAFKLPCGKIAVQTYDNRTDRHKVCIPIEGGRWRLVKAATAVYDPATCRVIAEYLRNKWLRVSAGEVSELAGKPLPVDDSSAA